MRPTTLESAPSPVVPDPLTLAAQVLAVVGILFLALL